MRDSDVRNLVKQSFLKKYYNDSNARVVEEMGICQGEARIDIAVINGSLHGYEIKSEKDNLIRLPSQMEMYRKVFDYITIVCGDRHLKDIELAVPNWCGIIAVTTKKNSEGYKLKKIRNSYKNNDVNSYNLAQLLWKEEILLCLSQLGYIKGMANRNKAELWKILGDLLSQNELRYRVRSILKAREQWRSDLLPSENDGCSLPFAR